ncbi:MAG TPA: sigma-70 family RNA polymerase sigma factor, partial [Chitinophaga sp.]|uniref:RNA polymerase sigma factor n=1 Tax=Chitinophaga sp. TaxID=1869181 RepID=UPI002B5973D9
TFDISRPFNTWLAKIMVNTAIDFLRSKKKLVFTSDVEQMYDLGTDSKVVEKLSYEELLKLVQTLTPAYRTVFNLYVMEGFQHHEIAEMLDISVGTSKSNLFKAKKILQEKIIKAASTGIIDDVEADTSIHKK